MMDCVAFIKLVVATGLATLSLVACSSPHSTQFVFAPRAARPVSEQIAPNAHSPQLGMDPNGTISLLAVYGDRDRSRLALLESRDGGDAFTKKIDVSIPTRDVQGWGESSPVFAVAGEYERAVWQEELAGRDTLAGAKMLLWGKKFDPQVAIANGKAPASASYPSISTFGKTVYVTWLDARSPHSKDTLPVYLGISHDGGSTFANVRVSDASCPCCRPASLVAPDGTIYVAWRWVFSHDVRDVVVASSSDGGLTFGKPVRVHADGWAIAGCPESGPSLAYFQNRLYIAWHTVAPSGEGIVNVASSADRGRTFSIPERASAGVLDATHPRIAASRSDLVLVFDGRDPNRDAGWGASRAYFAASEGRAFSAPQPLSDGQFSVSAPAVMIRDEATVYVAATQTRGGQSSILLYRGRKAARAGL